MREGWHVAADWIVGTGSFAIVFLVVCLPLSIVDGLPEIAIAAISAMFSSVVAVHVVRQRRRERSTMRMPANRCDKCGYDLTGNTSGVCPECGSAVKGGGRRYWRDHPDRREGLCGIIRAAIAELTTVSANAITSETTMQAVWERQFDGPDEVELVCMLEKRLHIHIADESAEKWWRTHSDLDMTFGEFSRALAEHLEPLVLQCVECEYDLTGSVSDVCPECGEPI
jgi:rubrerythrin